MKYIILLLSILFAASCSPKKDEQLEFALSLSGENRSELLAVLNHYKHDSLKLEAARFLITNMPYHYSKEEYYVSPEGEMYRPNITTFSGKEAVAVHCDSLLKARYKIHQSKIYDIRALDSAFLVENIELAFSAWQKPWAKNVPFKDFCRYILPYRAQTEKTTTLRKEIMERFIPILDSAKVTSPLDACIVLNEHLQNVIKYKDTGLAFYPTIDETYRAGISTCDGMCNLGTFIMRSVGIPTAIDFTIWTKMDLGHSWCAVLDNGHFYSFGPGEEQPKEHAKRHSEIRHRRPAKVYRYRFDPIGKKDKENDGYDTFLKGNLLYDVTTEYLDTTTSIKVTTDKKGITVNSTIYLCAYNHYTWKAIAMGSIVDKNICTFDNVVGDNIFIVADCVDGKHLRYITAPFYVNRNGEVHKFIPDINLKERFTVKKRKLRPKDNHTLFYWDVTEGRFISIPAAKIEETTQSYEQAPKNALYWLTIPEKIVNQRIFFMQQDSLRYY